MPDKEGGSRSKTSSSGGDKEKKHKKSEAEGGKPSKKEDRPSKDGKEHKDKSKKEVQNRAFDASHCWAVACLAKLADLQSVPVDSQQARVLARNRRLACHATSG